MIKRKLQDVKRSLILEEAAALFESVGYEQLKLSELAKKVGISVGTIYGLFESKEGLYFAYAEDQIGRFLDELDTSFAQTELPEERLRQLFTFKFARFVAKRKAIEECAKNNPLFFSDIRLRVPELMEKIYVRIAGIIREIAPEKSEAEALKLAYVLNGLSDGYLMYWFAHDGDLLARMPELHAQMLTMIKGC